MLETPVSSDAPALIGGPLPLVDGESRLDQASAAPGIDVPGARTRVLHVINGEHYAGAERAQDLMALRLPELGYDVTFVCLKEGRFRDVRRSQATPLVTIPMRSRFDLRPARAIARMVHEGGFSLIHTHTCRGALVGSVAAALSRVPLVHHVQSPTSRDSIHHNRDRVNAIVESLALRRAAAAIAVSESLATYARQWKMAGRRVAVVPNGVPARPALADRRPPANQWTIGTVALFRPRKGLDVLLKALAEVRREGYPARLWAVGRFETPEYEAHIMALVKELGLSGAIEWRGFRQDVQAELAKMDLFILPSLFGEGLPLVIVEAMSAGVPAIGTRVEGVPEVIREDRDGLIAEPGDEMDMARAIRRVLDGEVDWQALRASAFERQSRHFTDRSMAEGVAAVYASVLATRPSESSEVPHACH